MNDHHAHDVDIVAALAGGWIDDDEERTAAEVLVEDCEECRAEFELHTDVSTWLSSAAEVSMTDEERESLHRRVHAEAAPGGNVVAMPDRSARATRGWLRIGSVAAALVMVVGVGGILTQLDGADSGETSADGGTADTAAAEAADPVEGLLRDDSGGGDAATALQSEETAAAAAPESAEDMDESLSDGSVAGYGGPVAAPVVEDSTDHDSGALRERAAAFADEVAAREDPPLLTADDFSAREAPTPECFTTAVEPAYGVLLTTLEGRPVQVFVVAQADSGALSPLVLRPDDSCTVVDLP
jgi:hypothetical protein